MMRMRVETPCDFGPCPYDAEGYNICEYFCSEEEEPEDYYDDDCDYDVGFDPYMGCFTDDC